MFTCSDYTRMVMVEVKTPPFSHGMKQLEIVGVDWSRELSQVRIHVERVIGSRQQNILFSNKPFPLVLG